MPVDCDAFVYSRRPDDGKEYIATPHEGAYGGYVYKFEAPKTFFSSPPRYDYGSGISRETKKPKTNRCCCIM
jgi:hypothetical protein